MPRNTNGIKLESAMAVKLSWLKFGPSSARHYPCHLSVSRMGDDEVKIDIEFRGGRKDEKPIYITMPQDDALKLIQGLAETLQAKK